MSTAAASDVKAPSRLFDISPLENDGSNFPTWKFRVQTVLEIRNLMNIVNGKELCPVPADKDNTGAVDAWNTRDREARAQITLTLKDEPLNGVMYATTAKETWDKLKDRYEGQGKQTIAYLIGELFRNTLDDELPLGPQMDSMVQKGHLIRSLGQVIDDTLIAIAIVISLPPSYATLKTILMSTDGSLTSEKVVTQVLREEKDRRHGTEATALVARYGKGKGNPGAKSADPKKKLKCDYCKKRGHVKDECRKLQADQAKPKDQPKELVAKVATSKNDDLVLFMAADTKRQLKLQHWILDSGASCSMSSQRESFQTLQKLVSPRPVWLGDDNCIYATHTGTISFEFSTSSGTRHQASFSNVYYVPDLAGNLLSISHLTSLHYTVEFTKDGCSIVNSSTGFRGLAELRGGIYHVQCRVLVPARALISEIYDFQAPDPSQELPLAAYAAKDTKSKADATTWH